MAMRHSACATSAGGDGRSAQERGGSGSRTTESEGACRVQDYVLQRRLICISVTTRAAWRDRCHHSKRTSSSSTVASGGHTIVSSSTCDTFSCKSRLTCAWHCSSGSPAVLTDWHSRAHCGALPSECDQQQRCGTNAADRPGLNRRHRRRCLFVCA
jgi:hypothetical protein